MRFTGMTFLSKAQIAAVTAPHKVSLRLAEIRVVIDERERLMARLARKIDEPAAERAAARLEELNDG